jgi:hypothetical protein
MAAGLWPNLPSIAVLPLLRIFLFPFCRLLGDLKGRTFSVVANAGQLGSKDFFRVFGTVFFSQ